MCAKPLTTLCLCCLISLSSLLHSGVYGFWRNTSCVIHVALRWHASKREGCTLYVYTLLHYCFLISLSAQAVSLLPSLARIKGKHPLINTGMRELSYPFLFSVFSLSLSVFSVCYLLFLCESTRFSRALRGMETQRYYTLAETLL